MIFNLRFFLLFSGHDQFTVMELARKLGVYAQFKVEFELAKGILKLEESFQVQTETKTEPIVTQTLEDIIENEDGIDLQTLNQIGKSFDLEDDLDSDFELGNLRLEISNMNCPMCRETVSDSQICSDCDFWMCSDCQIVIVTCPQCEDDI